MAAVPSAGSVNAANGAAWHNKKGADAWRQHKTVALQWSGSGGYW